MRSSSSRPRASIVIPTFHQVAYTTACLVALAENTGDDYEVIIVDNASSDGTEELLQRLDGDVVIIRNPVNRGFAVACNQGAAAAQADVVVFLNNDTEPGPGWLEPLLAVLDARPEVGAVGSRLLFPDGLVQHAGVVVVEDGRPGGEPLGAVHALYRRPADDPEVCLPRDVQVVTGACLAVRREVFHDVGGFDEGYWNGNEDVDLCFAIGAAGHTVAYEPASVLVHHESVSGPERFVRAAENVERLKRKWWGRVVPDVLSDEHGVRPHPARASRAARRSWQRRTGAVHALQRA